MFLKVWWTLFKLEYCNNVDFDLDGVVYKGNEISYKDFTVRHIWNDTILTYKGVRIKRPYKITGWVPLAEHILEIIKKNERLCKAALIYKLKQDEKFLKETSFGN